MPDLARTRPTEQQPQLGDAQVVHTEANVGRCEVSAGLFHLLVGEHVLFFPNAHVKLPLYVVRQALHITRRKKTWSMPLGPTTVEVLSPSVLSKRLPLHPLMAHFLRRQEYTGSIVCKPSGNALKAKCYG